MHPQRQIEKLPRRDFRHRRQPAGSRIQICESNAGEISRREVGNFRNYGNLFSGNCELFQPFSKRRALCTYKTTVTLKIEKTLGEHGTIIKLIGRIREEHLSELNAQIIASGPRIILELGEVSLVDADAVRFLSGCESEGIQLLNCSAYIRKWIARERESARKG
jgi:hypothetical protein